MPKPASYRLATKKGERKMTNAIIARQVKQIFSSNKAIQETRVRGLRSGRVDSSRVARTMAGQTRVFQRTRITEGEGYEGSLAICSCLQDLYYRYNHNDPLSKTWETTIQSIEAGAQAIGVITRCFSANKRYDPRSWDTSAEMLRDHGVNSWPRNGEAVAQAQEWHQSKGSTNQITLIVTMFPDIDGPEVNRDGRLFDQYLMREAEKNRQATRGMKFYVLGIHTTIQDTWGEFKRRGPRAVLEGLYPSSSRYYVEEEGHLPAALVRLAQSIARTG
jgi:hypothetical protein